MPFDQYFKATTALVAVVDDDESVRESLPDLLHEFGLAAKGFATPMDFLASPLLGKTKCLISDVAMPGMSGPALRRELIRRGYAIPTIFITANPDTASRPDVMEGAVACLIKPFEERTLLDALKKALDLKKSG